MFLDTLWPAIAQTVGNAGGAINQYNQDKSGLTSEKLQAKVADDKIAADAKTARTKYYIIGGIVLVVIVIVVIVILKKKK